MGAALSAKHHPTPKEIKEHARESKMVEEWLRANSIPGSANVIPFTGDIRGDAGFFMGTPKPACHECGRTGDHSANCTQGNGTGESDLERARR